MNATLVDELTAPEFLDASGLSYRRLDHWTRLGYLRTDRPCPGSGFARTWPRAEVDVARRLARLADAGILPERAVPVARGGQWIADGIRVELVDAPLAPEQSTR
jgi:hypothetical protein